MARRLGKAGERRFATLCADYGAVCNKPEEDESGWDAIVDLPARPVPGLPADLQSATPALLVQVKSHEKPVLRIQLKLSNALKFARADAPCFVVLMILPSDSDVPRFYAVHFWEVLIARTLQRAREASHAAIAEEQLNKHTLTITFGPEDEHSDDLLAWMDTTVRTVGRDYAGAKRLLRETVGYGPDQFGGSVTIGPLESVEQLIDHQLGLGANIPISGFRFHNRRFGIDFQMPMPEGDIHSARLLANPADRCRIRLRGPDGTEAVIHGDVIVPSVGNLPDEHFKTRFRSPVLDIVWAWSGSSAITGNIDTAALLDPSTLEAMARIAGWGGQGPVDVQVYARDQRIMAALANIAGTEDQANWSYLADLVGTLAKLSAYREVVLPNISIEQVLDSEFLQGLHLFLTAETTSVTAPAPADGSVPEVDHGVAYALTSVGSWVFGALVKMPVRSQSLARGQWVIEFGPAKIAETYAFDESEPNGVEMLRADYPRYAKVPGAVALDSIMLLVHKDRNGAGTDNRGSDHPMDMDRNSDDDQS